MSVNVTMDDAARDMPFPGDSGGDESDAVRTNVTPDGQTPEQQQPEEEGPPDHLALKYTFYTPKNGDACGGFCLIFNGQNGKIVHQTLWLTRREGGTINFRPSEHWQAFIKSLMKLGPYDKIWGDKLNALLPEIIPPSDRVDIFNEMSALDSETNRHKLMHLKGEIRRGFERATHSFLEVDCDTELLSRKELEKVGLLHPAGAEQAVPEAKKESDEEEKSFNGTIIHCTPLIDPVWGKASSTIVPGDFIEVEIEEHMGASGLVRKFLETTNQTPIFPVEEISVRDGRTRIYLRINDEIIGMITLTKDIKLRTKQTLIDKESERTAIDDLVFFGALAVALVGLLLTLRYLLF